MELLDHQVYQYENTQHKAEEVFAALERAFAGRGIPDIKTHRHEMKEGGMMSQKRSYLRITATPYCYDIGAGLYGPDFFVSVRKLSLGPPSLDTYYQQDIHCVKNTAVEALIERTVKDFVTPKGINTLSSEGQRPVLADFVGEGAASVTEKTSPPPLPT